MSPLYTSFSKGVPLDAFLRRVKIGPYNMQKITHRYYFIATKRQQGGRLAGALLGPSLFPNSTLVHTKLPLGRSP